MGTLIHEFFANHPDFKKVEETEYIIGKEYRYKGNRYIKYKLIDITVSGKLVFGSIGAEIMLVEKDRVMPILPESVTLESEIYNAIRIFQTNDGVKQLTDSLMQIINRHRPEIIEQSTQPNNTKT